MQTTVAQTERNCTPVEHHREGDEPAKAALTITGALRRERLPDDVDREAEINRRPDGEGLGSRREVGPVRREGPALRILNRRAAEGSEADGVADDHEDEGRDHQDLAGHVAAAC